MSEVDLLIRAAHAHGAGLSTAAQSRMNTPFTLMNAAAVASLTVPAIVVMILNKYILSGVLEGSYR
jgi:ABC-type glycerol-3-phosphate transport system permease component